MDNGLVRFILLPDYVPSSSRSGGLTRAAVFLGSRASSPQTVLVASLSRACRGLEARDPRKPMAHRVGVRMRIVRNQVLLCEGSSDRALVPHLRQLLSHCGAPVVVGSAIALSTIRDPGPGRGSVLERKIHTILSNESEIDLLFIHRDADAVGYENRSREIAEALRNLEFETGHVPVIPVRATEAWILLDDDAIRRVAGNPRGRQPLNLPRPARVEREIDPKRALEIALTTASGHSGNRLKKFRSRFGQHRRILLEQLPVGGALDEVPAWLRLKEAVLEFIPEPR